ncbi:lytic transglycosylase domain-containing protein [Nitrospina watsonii]|nr:lytic transglycosylase domain-containing protein [Nitrospina watsonii]
MVLKARFETIRQERRIKNRIHEVMRKYNSRLDKKRMRRISNRIFSESRKNGHDPLLLTALIVTESSFNQQAESHKGALGLMQIRPATGSAMATEAQMAWKGDFSLLNPDTNIALGALYLKKMQKRFRDLDLALEAYNHGPSQLSRYLRQGKKPKTYSRKVMKMYSQLRSKTT